MNITMVDDDIFDDKYTEYHKVQCISLDCRMGMGIAQSFTRRYPYLKQDCKNIINSNNLQTPVVIKHSDLFNLVTKDHYWDLPTYSDIDMCIFYLSELCKKEGITKLAMPKIGCNLDRLSWKAVKRIIEKHFNDMNIEIIVFTGRRKRNV